MDSIDSARVLSNRSVWPKAVYRIVTFDGDEFAPIDVAGKCFACWQERAVLVDHDNQPCPTVGDPKGF